MRTNSLNPTRKLNTILSRKKRSHRVAIVAGSFVAVAGLVGGGAFAATSAVAAQERVAATTALAQSTGLDRAQLGAYAYAGVAEAHTDSAASIVLVKANKVIAVTKGKVDSSALTKVASSLASFETLPLEKVVSLTAKTKAETASVTAAAAKADQVAAAAKAAADKAAKAAADKAAAAKAKAPAQGTGSTVTPSGGNSPEAARATAKAMASSKYGWGAGEFSCLDQLWEKESGWNYLAYNPSGATGIPQALPGSKMATAGSDWATNATTQIAWGLEYISASSYGTPCAAWSHSQANNWY